MSQFYVFMRNPEETDKVWEELQKLLTVFEQELKDKYFAGKSHCKVKGFPKGRPRGCMT